MVISTTCHCEVDSRTTRQSIVSRTTRTEYSVRFLAHSGSPRAFSPRDDKVRKPFLDYEITPGLRVPGMALLGYRPFGPSPSRSAFPFRHVRHPSVHSSLPYCCWKPTRKPRWLSRVLGGEWRLAERRCVPALIQEPPRVTRVEPDAGPVGLTTGLPLG